MAPITKDSTTDGPALSAEASAVRMKSPAPMIAPMPSATRLFAVSVRLRWLSFACASRVANDFLRVRLIRFSRILSFPDYLSHHSQKIAAHDLLDVGFAISALAQGRDQGRHLRG